MQPTRNKHRIRFEESGATLVIAAIIAFFVALVALTTLALTKSQIQSIDDQTDSLNAKLVSESSLDEAILKVREDDPDSPVEIAGLSQLSDQELINLLRNPETGQGGVYATSPERNFYNAMERLPFSSMSSPNFQTISGYSLNAVVVYVDDSTLVRNSKDYDYRKRDDLSENLVVTLGETRRNESDARTALTSKIFDQQNTLLEKRDVNSQAFNVNHPNPPYIESEHNGYKPNQRKHWTLYYPSDPSHPNRKVTGIDLMINPANLELGSAGDKIYFSAWDGAEFISPFDVLTGPISLGSTSYKTSSPSATNAMRVTMETDAIDDLTSYGFLISGVEYHFDNDLLPALYETPHPYGELENNTSFTEKPTLTQVIYSPYALPKDRVNPIISPGDDVILPNGNGSKGDIGGNGYQVMRIHFDDQFSLESGDVLEVYNGNTGELIAAYVGTTGAGKYTPWAFRSNPDFPLALVLSFKRDGNNDSGTTDYGYKVDFLDYTDINGDLRQMENPTQKTAHGSNMGYNDGLGGEMRSTVICKPADPELGGTVTNWDIVFDASSDLVDSLGDTDEIILKKSGLIVSPTDEMHFVAAGNPNFGKPGYYDIAYLRGMIVDMDQRLWLEIISNFDNSGSFTDASSNYGWSVSYLDVQYDNAIAQDMSPARLRSSSITLRSVGDKVASVETVSYPAFGNNSNNRGEWWVNSKDHSQILLHFDLESFRLENGDIIRIYDENGQIVKELIPEATTSGFEQGGPIGGGTGGSGGGPIDVNFVPNPPLELVDTHGWVIVPSQSAMIRLLGDGSSNDGYSGFDLDRVAYWSPNVLIRNEATPFSSEKTDAYGKKQSKKVKKYKQN